MSPKEFLNSKGIPDDDQVAFNVTGARVMISLADLLSEYAAQLATPSPAPAKKKASK